MRNLEAARSRWTTFGEASIDMRRFRPNIVLRSRRHIGSSNADSSSCGASSTGGYEAYSEDQWDELRITSTGTASAHANPSSSLTRSRIQSTNSHDARVHANANADAAARTDEALKAHIHLVARCERCILTSVDPQTAERDIQVPLGLLRRSRKLHKHEKRAGPCFGMYGVPGRVGGAWRDAVALARRDAAECQSELGTEKEEKEKEAKEEGYGSVQVGDWVAVRWRLPGTDVLTS